MLIDGIFLEQFESRNEIFETNPPIVEDDGANFKISYDYSNRHFTINMKYFIIEDILFGFVNFEEQNNELDDDSSYLVGLMLYKCIYNKFGNIGYFLVLYTDKNEEGDFYQRPKNSLSTALFCEIHTDTESEKYKFIIASTCRKRTAHLISSPQIVDFLDNGVFREMTEDDIANNNLAYEIPIDELNWDWDEIARQMGIDLDNEDEY